jgi:hypothetical protein
LLTNPLLPQLATLYRFRLHASTMPCRYGLRQRGSRDAYDFTTSSSPVDIEALAARYQNEEFWRRSLLETDNDGPE